MERKLGSPRYGTNYGFLAPVAAPAAVVFDRGRFSVENVDAVPWRAAAVQQAEGFVEAEGLGLVRNGLGLAAFYLVAKSAEYVSNVWLTSNIGNPYAGYAAAGFALNCSTDPTTARPFRHVGIDPAPPGLPGIGTTVCGTGGTSVGNAPWGYTIPKGSDLVNLNSNSIPLSATRDGYVFERLFGTGPGLKSVAALAHGGVRELPQELARVGQAELTYELPRGEPRLRPYEVAVHEWDYDPVEPPPPGSRGVPGVHQKRKPRRGERERKQALRLLTGALRVGMTVHQVLSCMAANGPGVWQRFGREFGRGPYRSRGKSLEDLYQYVSDNFDSIDLGGAAQCVAGRQLESIAIGEMGKRLSPDLRRSTNSGWWVPKWRPDVSPRPSRPEVIREGRKSRSQRMR